MVSKELEAFIELIETIADNKLILGDRLVKVGIGGPNLEATLSSIAMAQGELGHARLLYNWAFDLKGQSKQDVRSQTGKAFTSTVKVDDWISLLAAACAVNTGTDLVQNAMLEARHSEVVGRIHKLIKEQEEHIVYCTGWAVQLLNDQGAIPCKFREAFDAGVNEVSAWLAKTESSKDLTDGGYIQEQSALVSKFREKVVDLLAQENTTYVRT